MSGNVEEAGVDGAASDAGTVDAGVEAAVDAGLDTGLDTGLEVGLDAGLDVGLADATLGDSMTDAASTPGWRRLNGGAPLLSLTTTGSSIASVETVKTANGDLIWIASTTRYGAVLGRLDDRDHWQVFRDGDFRDAVGAAPSSLSPSFASFRGMHAFADPRRPDGFLILANQRLHYGVSRLDVHGFPSFHRFDGHESRAWASGVTFDPYAAGPIIYGWTGTGDDGASFAYDAAHDEGIAVGTTGMSNGGFLDQLVATRYDGADTAQSWRLWRRAYDSPGGDAGAWHVDNQWADVNDRAASRRELILDPRINLARYAVQNPRILHLAGTRDYLVSFLMADTTTPTEARVIGAALYEHGSASPWSYWSGAGFRPVAAESGTFAEAIATIAAPGVRAVEALPFGLPGGDAILMIADEEDHRLDARVYDASERTFGPTETLVRAVGGQKVLVEAALRADGSLLAAFGLGAREVVARVRREDGEWTTAETIFVGEGTSSPVGVAEVDGRSIVLVRDGEALYAVSRGVAGDWSRERPLVVREPGHVALAAPPGLVIESQALNASTRAYYGPNAPGQIAIDDDGYAYATRTTTCSVIVHAPGSVHSDTNRSWGGFFDILSFPAGVAFDSVRDRVFVTSEIIEEGAGGIGKVGALSIWESEPYRDRNIGRRGSGGPLPEGYSRGFVPRLLRPGMRFPSSAAIDAARGVLYVTSSLSHEIYAFDIAGIRTRMVPFDASSLATNVGAHDAQVQAVVDGLTSRGMLIDRGGGQLAFAVGLSLFGEVEAAIRSVGAFASLPTPSADELLRNFSSPFQAALSPPPLLFRWGAYGGSTLSQLRFPMGLAVDGAGDLYVVDTDNHRVIQLSVDVAARYVVPRRSFGHPGMDDGGLLYPVGVTVTEDGRVWVADPRNHQVVVFGADGAFDFRFTEVIQGGMTFPMDGNAIAAGREGTLAFASGRSVVRGTWGAP